MIFEQIDFNLKHNKEKLFLKELKYPLTWEHYYDCYNFTTAKILEKGLDSNDFLNLKERPLLFLLRHCFELCLKYNLSKNNLTIPKFHEFGKIYPAFAENLIVPEKFNSITKRIEHSTDCDGSCYRYFESKNNMPFFVRGKYIEIADLLIDYINLPSDDSFTKGYICKDFDHNNRVIRSKLTLSMGECKGLGHIKTQYDQVIEFLVNGILNESFDINRTYLPLFFLIRHSLEIGLKFNLEQSNIELSDYNSIHSLEKLYNLFNNYLSKLDLNKMSDVTKNQYNLFKNEYIELEKIIKRLDHDSLSFRFPINQKGKNLSLRFKENDLLNAIRLFYFTDPFITFTIAVLKDEDIINLQLDEYYYG